MNIIKELETKIDSMITKGFSAISELEKVLKNPDDSNEIKIFKASCIIDFLKGYEKNQINNIIYAEKTNDIIHNFNRKILFKIMESLELTINVDR